MIEHTISGLKVRLTGGVDRAGGGDGPMVVLLHGFGAPGTDLVPLWRELSVPSSVRFCFAEAPLTMPPEYGDGRAWWHIDMFGLHQAIVNRQFEQLARHVPDGLAEARRHVLALLEGLSREHHVTPERLVLGGFSQGAMLACDVALHSKLPLAGLALLSAMVIAEDEWASLMPDREGLPVLQTHGRSDPVLPFQSGVRLRDLLTDAGLEVDWIEFNGGHGIPGMVIEALSRFIARVTGGS